MTINYNTKINKQTSSSIHINDRFSHSISLEVEKCDKTKFQFKKREFSSQLNRKSLLRGHNTPWSHIDQCGCKKVETSKNIFMSWIECSKKGWNAIDFNCIFPSKDENISSSYVEDDNEGCGHVVKFPAIVFALIGIVVFTVCIIVILCLCWP